MPIERPGPPSSSSDPLEDSNPFSTSGVRLSRSSSWEGNAAPPSEHGPAQRKWWRKKRFWIALVALVSLYPTVVTVALWSGFVERMLASEDLRVEIDKPAYSIIPGHVSAKGIRIYMNGVPQFTLFAKDIHAHIQILPLLRRRFTISALEADDVRFRMRLPLEPKSAQDPRTRAFPKLEGIPGINSVRKEKAQAGEEKDSPWTVNLHNLKVHVTELWFFEYRYLGRGELRGGFERGPDVLRVNTSVQNLGPGKLYFGEDHVISHNFRGRVEAEIPEVNPKEHANLSFFDFVRTDIELHADAENLEHVSAYVAPGQVTEGGGPLDIKLILDKGKLAADTLISYETQEVNYKADGIGVKSDFALEIDVGKGSKNAQQEAPHLTSTAQVTYVSLAKPGGNPFTIQLHNHREEAALASTTIDEQLEIEHASIHLPKIVTTDLDDVRSLSGGKWKSKSGEANGSLLLEMDEEKNFHGPFEMKFSGLEAEVDPVGVKWNGKTSARVSILPQKKRLMLSDLDAQLRNVDFLVDESRVDDWWLNFESKKAEFGWGDPATIFADFTFAARDAEPILEVLTEGSKVPGVVADLIRLRNLRSKMKVRKRGERLDVMVEKLESSFIDFSGRIYRDGDKQAFALLIGGKVVSLGIYDSGQQKRFRPLAHADWLNEKLDAFPPPLESVEGQQP